MIMLNQRTIHGWRVFSIRYSAVRYSTTRSFIWGFRIKQLTFLICLRQKTWHPMSLTQFISHRLCRWEIKRFYRYREGMLHGCKPDRRRWLMNWYKKEFLLIFYNLLVYAGRTPTTKSGWSKQYTWWIGQEVIKTDKSDKTEIKKCHENNRDIAVVG